MNGVRYLPVLVVVSMLLACSDSNVTSNVPADMGTSSDMAGAVDMPSTPPDMSDAPVDMGADMGQEPREDMQADQGSDMGGAGEDMPDAMPVELPFEQKLGFEYNEDEFRRTSASLPLSPQPEGVILLRVSWNTATADAPQRPVSVRLCTTPPGDCVGQNPAIKVEGEVEVHTFVWESLPDQNYTIELDAYAPADVLTVFADISIEFLPWQDTMGEPVWAKQAAPIVPPAAIRGVLPGGSISTNPSDYTTHWFSWSAPLLGTASLRKIDGGSFTSVLCASDAMQAPWNCVAESATARLDVSRSGAQRFVLKNPYEEASDYKLVFLYEPFADALTCEPGKHPDGVGACVTEGACASGFHDGGQGHCVPTGECDPAFELDEQGACFGWSYEGNVPSFAEIETFWSSTNEIIELSDGKFFNTNNLDETDMLPDRSRPLIFDPVTVSWIASQTEEPTPSVYRSCALADGRVLAVGYGAPGDPNLKNERIYDPASDSWKELADESGVVWGNGVMCRLLSNGKTLVISSGTRSKVFDASTEQWSDFPGFPVEYRGKFLTELTDGTLVTAVESAQGNPDEVMILRANATEWEALANWPVADSPINNYMRFWVCGASEFCTWGTSGGTKYNVQTNQPVALQAPRFGAPGAFIEDSSGVYLGLTTRGVAQYTAATDSWSEVTPRPFGCLAMTLEPVTKDILCAHNYISRFER